MPQYYDMGDDPLNRRDIFNETSRMHPGDARYLQKMDGRAQVAFGGDTGPQQGPRMHNPLMDPRINSAGLANIHPDVAAAVYGRPNNKFDMLNAPVQALPRETAGLKFLQAQEMLRGAPTKPIMGRRGGETPDLALVRAELANIRPDVYTASDFVGGPPGNAAEMLMGQPKKPNMGMRRGETADSVIRQEIMRRRRLR